MAKNLYVGNLPFSTTSEDLEQLFGQHGQVTRAQVMSDRETGRSRGFGFVEMGDGADAAIQALNGNQFQGRASVRPRGRVYTIRTAMACLGASVPSLSRAHPQECQPGVGLVWPSGSPSAA